MFSVEHADKRYVVKAVAVEFLDAFYADPRGFTREVTRNNKTIDALMLAFLNERALEIEREL